MQHLVEVESMNHSDGEDLVADEGSAAVVV